MATTLTTKSQVTLPKPIRDYLKVAPGDQVEFQIMADGSVSVVPVRQSPPATAAERATLARLRALRGTLDSDLSTDEWMNLLRGYDEDDSDPGFATAPVRARKKPA
jgi:antitoxin PrlF